MATTYDEMIQRVLTWSNRDPDVFGASTSRPSGGWTRASAGELSEFLEYAADKCYRALRVPPLEYTRQFVVGENDFVSPDRGVDTGGITTVNMPVPVDLIDVIYFRCGGTIINEKLDPRTFYDRYSVKKSGFFWTRVGNIFQVSGPFAVGDTIEIHYYRRLPAMDAAYLVTAATYNLDSSLFSETQEGLYTGAAGTLWFEGADRTTASDSEVGDFDTEVTLYGREIEHWLRNENERIVLFGALMEAFNYLDEPEQLQKFQSMFLQEISELNVEENLRQTQGGNISVNFNSQLI